ncbi:MAG: Card1-like endonuclease domain-containing protein, partial [Pyrinomonadaceae bacterium]
MAENDLRTALLILVGGRQMPNFLTAQFLQPDIIAPVASHEAMRAGQAWSKLESALRQMGKTVLEPEVVDAFDLQEIREACVRSLRKSPEAKWVFNVTCATTVMSIAAYEVAKENRLACWYLDTDTQRVTVLSGSPPDGRLFRVSVADYMRIYGRAVVQNSGESPDAAIIQLVSELAREASQTTRFQKNLVKATAGQRVRERLETPIEMDAPDDSSRRFLSAAQDAKLIKGLEYVSSNKARFVLLGKESLDFLNGGWLELHVWLTAKETGRFADDEICYSFKIPADGQENQIDFAVTHAGALLIAECKSEEHPFKGSYLDKLSAIAG